MIKKLKDELQASNSDAAAFKKLHDTMIKMNDEKLQKTVKEYQQESDATIKEFKKKVEEFQESIEKLRNNLQASNSDAAAFKKLHDTMIERKEEKFQKRIKECQEESYVARKECERKETSLKEMQKELDRSLL